MIDSRCGLICAGCPWKQSHGCGGCVPTHGRPFHGECRVAMCCQERGLAHCGECDELPCTLLYEYSFANAEHGDHPPGERVARLRRWAAEAGSRRWDNVLLTSAGWRDARGRVLTNILSTFQSMLGKPPSEARVLFVPTAAISDEARAMLPLCREELLLAGIRAENLVDCNLNGPLDAEAARSFDAIYVAGGDTRHLLRRVRETGFDRVVKRMVYAGKTYVGVSAGSLILTPGIGGRCDANAAALALVHAFLSVHCAPGTPPRLDLPLPQIPLTDRQALRVGWAGWTLIQD